MDEDSILQKLRSAGLSMKPAGSAFEVAGSGVDASFLSPGEHALIEDWASPRQMEFTAGRLCVRRALVGLGRSGGELLRDTNGLPLWPEGVSGSITHCRGIAAAALRPFCGETATLIGLDLEQTNRLSAAASHRVLHPLERGFAGADQVRATVLFSLKEAFYKAQFARWRQHGNFQDIGLKVDLEAGQAVIAALDERFDQELVALRFRFALVGDYVLSLCWSPTVRSLLA